MSRARHQIDNKRNNYQNRTATPKTKNKVNSKAKNHSRGISLLFIIFLIIFLYSSYKLLKWGIDNKKSEEINEKIKSEVITVTKINNTPIENFGLNIDFEKLKSINNDVVGYIEITNTDVSYPILQTENNEYYLDRDIYKNYNSCGSIFMSYYCNSKFSSQNTVLFGHNMKSGKMFAVLNNILNRKQEPNIDINIYTPTSNIKYKPFSIYISEPNINPITNSFENEQKFIDNAIFKSTVDFNIHPNTEEKLLTLSTCDGSGKNRTILHAVKFLEEIK